MNHPFDHHLEAQRYADTVTSIPARGALLAIHNLILETGGMHLRFLPERYRPIQTLDVLFFYPVARRLRAACQQASHVQTASSRETLPVCTAVPWVACDWSIRL